MPRRTRKKLVGRIEEQERREREQAYAVLALQLKQQWREQQTANS